MQVDSLPRGRHQPFYRVLSLSGTAYCAFCHPALPFSHLISFHSDVAEENIEPVYLIPSLALEFIKNNLPIGQYFKSFVYASSKSGYGYMVSTNFLSQAYPNDEAFIKENFQISTYAIEGE